MITLSMTWITPFDASMSTGTKGAALKMLHHIRSVSVHPAITAIENADEFIDLSGRLKACFEIIDGIHRSGWA